MASMATAAHDESTPGKGPFRSKGSISAHFSHSLAGIVPGMSAFLKQGRNAILLPEKQNASHVHLQKTCLQAHLMPQPRPLLSLQPE